MSTISVYTTTYNSIDQEYCIVEGIRSALGFADEVIVVDSHSNDGTVEAIESINDPRIKIYEIDWLPRIGWAMYKIAKSMAIGRCTKDWCVLMDADEVFHELDYDKIKKVPYSVADNIIGVKFNTLHFYGDYKHLLNGSKSWKDLYTNKVYMVRNGLGIHHGNSGMDIDAHVDRYGIPLKQEYLVHLNISAFHYGHIRSDAAYLKKQNRMHSFYEGKEVNNTAIDRIDLKNLGTFIGTHPITMKNRVEK
jgi:glycosyltransferase involved in cell wall biosynthesis